jgi:hypothetical protein
MQGCSKICLSGKVSVVWLLASVEALSQAEASMEFVK